MRSPGQVSDPGGRDALARFPHPRYGARGMNRIPYDIKERWAGSRTPWTSTITLRSVLSRSSAPSHPRPRRQVPSCWPSRRWLPSPSTDGKAAAVCVVGNEDGAHKVSADLFQGLNDVGFSLAPNAVTYWVGEAMQDTDYQDLDKTPEKTAATTATLAANTAHLARRLKAAPYPAS